MSQQEVTTAFAVWGAITGTIGTIAGLLGLGLRFRQHSLDKAKLNCESSFGFDSPTCINHKLIIRSVGRRPVTIDFIRYFIVPRKRWHRLIKRWLHQKGRWLWDQKPMNPIKLTEGEKSEVKISLPSGLEINEICKAVVIDQSGAKWTVRWPSISMLSRIAMQKQIDSFEEQTNKRICSITGYMLGERYYLETKFNTKPGRTGVAIGRSFWLMDSASYKSKIENIRTSQFPKFLTGEIEEIT